MNDSINSDSDFDFDFDFDSRVWDVDAARARALPAVVTRVLGGGASSFAATPGGDGLAIARVDGAVRVVSLRSLLLLAEGEGRRGLLVRFRALAARCCVVVW